MDADRAPLNPARNQDVARQAPRQKNLATCADTRVLGHQVEFQTRGVLRQVEPVYAEDIDTTISRDIGARVRTQRELTGRSQTDVAHSLGITQREISRWETGAVRPSGRSLERLADELGCHWTLLAYGTDMSQ
jgi:ribosome-binding protein aMBF1 (putative translation factor)